MGYWTFSRFCGRLKGWRVREAPLMIEYIDHINIVVADLAVSVEFYTEVLGFKEVRRAYLEGDWIEGIVGLEGVNAEVVYVQPRRGGPRIELIHYHAPEGQALPETAQPHTHGLRHLAFRVEDIEEAYYHLTDAGVDFIGPPTRVPEATIKHDEGRKSLCYFRDPDGVILELAEYA